jgi:hypothetical protein
VRVHTIAIALALLLQDDAASKKTLEKINDYRRLAGLQPVALDPALSKGCLNDGEALSAR